MQPFEKYAANRPKVGDPVSYRGEPAGTVQRVEGNLCWVNYTSGTDPFIWAFKDGLNSLHDWLTKHKVTD